MNGKELSHCRHSFISSFLLFMEQFRKDFTSCIIHFSYFVSESMNRFTAVKVQLALPLARCLTEYTNALKPALFYGSSNFAGIK